MLRAKSRPGIIRGRFGTKHGYRRRFGTQTVWVPICPRLPANFDLAPTALCAFAKPILDVAWLPVGASWMSLIPQG